MIIIGNGFPKKKNADVCQTRRDITQKFVKRFASYDEYIIELNLIFIMKLVNKKENYL